MTPFRTLKTESDDLGQLLFKAKDPGGGAATAFLLLVGFPLTLIGLGTIGNSSDAGRVWLGILVGTAMSTAGVACFIVAAYYYRRHRCWYCHERGIMECTRWTSRTLLYSQVEEIRHSARRDFNSDGRYDRTLHELAFQPASGAKPVAVATYLQEQIELATDPMATNAIHEVRDRVAAIIADKMELQLKSSGSVRWIEQVELLAEGIEVTGKFGRKTLLLWNRISGTRFEEQALCLWGDDPRRPAVQIGTSEWNFYPGFQVFLKRLSSSPTRDRTDIADEFPTPAALPSDPIKTLVKEAPYGKLQCPHCGILTDSLKRYGFPRIVFLGLHISFQTERLAACPRCMRGYLLRWGSFFVLGSNVLWPFVVFPLFASRFAASFRRGHSEKRPSFPRQMAREIAHLALAGSVIIASVAGVFLALGVPGRESFITAVLAVSLISFTVFTAIGAMVDL